MKRKDPKALEATVELPAGYEHDSPSATLLGREHGGILAFLDGLPGMGKTVFLQQLARTALNRHLVFWWGETRPQWATFYPGHFKLLAPAGMELELVRQYPGERREETLEIPESQVARGLRTPQEFFEAAERDKLNVLLFSSESRNRDVLDFLRWLLDRRRGLEVIDVFIDETAKIAPGSVVRYDGSFDRGLRFARILEDARKSYVSILMSSHAPSDLWYVCAKKIQFHVAFAGPYNPRDRHSREAHRKLAIGEMYVNGPTKAGLRYDAGKVLPPPGGGGPKLLLRTSPDLIQMGWGVWPGQSVGTEAPRLPLTVRRLAEKLQVPETAIWNWAKQGREIPEEFQGPLREELEGPADGDAPEPPPAGPDRAGARIQARAHRGGAARAAPHLSDG